MRARQNTTLQVMCDIGYLVRQEYVFKKINNFFKIN